MKITRNNHHNNCNVFIKDIPGKGIIGLYCATCTHHKGKNRGKHKHIQWLEPEMASEMEAMGVPYEREFEWCRE